MVAPTKAQVQAALVPVQPVVALDLPLVTVVLPIELAKRLAEAISVPFESIVNEKIILDSLQPAMVRVIVLEFETQRLS